MFSPELEALIRADSAEQNFRISVMYAVSAAEIFIRHSRSVTPPALSASLKLQDLQDWFNRKESKAKLPLKYSLGFASSEIVRFRASRTILKSGDEKFRVIKMEAPVEKRPNLVLRDKLIFIDRETPFYVYQ